MKKIIIVDDEINSLKEFISNIVDNELQKLEFDNINVIDGDL